MSEPTIIFENDDFAAINKPAGLMVHAVRRKEGGKEGRRKKGEGKKRKQEREKKEVAEGRPPSEPTLTDWLVARWPAIVTVGDDPALRPGIVHRLDKGTSGVMVVAKTQAAFEKLKSLFQSHEMKKTYMALVSGIPKEEKGIIDRPIGIKNGTLKRSVHATTMVKTAVTEYEVKTKYQVPNAKFKEEYALLEVRPKTGRTHQIRVHLASIGHSIVGDPLYGSRSASVMLRAPRLMLHAKSIEFTDGTGNRFSFEAALPEDFVKVIHSLVDIVD
jgi:23S rRNA pseudouridine1911/1915/1917 synthase